MPALPNVPKVVKVILKHSIGLDIDAVNRIFIRYSATAPSDSDLAAFAASITTGWVSNILSLMSNDLALTEVTATDLTSPTAATGTDTTGGTGTGTGTRIPPGSALVIQNKVARRYRGGHSRVYLCGLEAANLDTGNPGQWSSGTISDFVAGWDAFITAALGAAWAGAGTIDQVNVSYFEGFTPFTYPSGRVRNIPNLRVTPLVDHVASFNVNHRVASQRRRNLQSA